MIGQILELLNTNEFEETQSEYIQIAKGKYKNTTKLSLIKKQIQWRRM